MGLISFVIPDISDPMSFLSQLRAALHPYIVFINENEVYTTSLRRLEGALVISGEDPNAFVPLQSMKRNAILFGPKYAFQIQDEVGHKLTGSVSPKNIHLTYDNPISPPLFDRLVSFLKSIGGSMTEHEDDEGNSLQSEGNTSIR